ncbi:MAG: cytidylate kinase-like family protein [Bacteroidales bacterium]|nr:cytidylate kinase-like family protein [Bacteroidales bacterium]
MENPKIIITINRESGSGGGEIARLLGEKLGLKVYGRAILQSVADYFNTTLEDMDRVKAQKANWWNDFCKFYRQFDTTSRSGDSYPEATPLTLYYAEARLLRELAEQESCIIVGRAGFHIFRDNPNALHLLIMADRDARIARIATKQNLSPEEAAKVIDKTDKARDTFVKTIADTSRYDARNYDFVLNVTNIPTDAVAQFLADNIRKKYPFLAK